MIRNAVLACHGVGLSSTACANGPDARLSAGPPCWAPSGRSTHRPRPRIDNTLVKALARAFRWKRMLESGRFGSLAELAEHEKINTSYLSRVLRLTLLAPEIVEAIPNGWQPEGMTLPGLMKGFPVDWDEQRLRPLK